MAAFGQMQPELVLELYSRMLTIRKFEELAEQASVEGFARGPIHQSIGQEAVAVGICQALRQDDLLQSNHRGHGHAIAKGTQPEAMMLELFGRAGGTNGGKGGSMHIADFSVGMMGANGILADGVTLGVGAAHAIKLKGEDRIAVAFVGDGTINRGPFYEGLNWAKVFGLPYLLVCENNGYASSTQTGVVTAGGGPLERVEAFGIQSHDVDGNDLFAVAELANKVVAQIRAGSGPQFIHARTYRLRGHISRDMLLYRRPGETEERWREEPIERVRDRLLDGGVSESKLRDMEQAVHSRLSVAYEQAKDAPYPPVGSAFADVQDLGAPSWSN